MIEALLEAREEKEVLLEVLLEAIEVKEALLEAKEEKEVLLEVLLEAIEEKEVLLEAKEEKEVILKPQWTPEILGKDLPLLQEATPLLEVTPLQEATPLQEVIDPPVFMPQPEWQSGSPQEATPLRGVGVILLLEVTALQGVGVIQPLEVTPQLGVIHLLHLPNIKMQIESQVP